jgi:DNA polymerase I-like protein with 3'-5' exonuclease and polymerase domains
MTGRPFADAVAEYALAGWPCILPVPLKKAPPPEGFTGADGRDTTPEDLVGWVGTHPSHSIALRMPEDIIGIDVDAYAKGQVVKHGDRTLTELEQRLGALPATWSSTARGADAASRIRFYRVPARRYVTKFPDVEIIQRHHRYAVVWPSPHPDAGDIYRWYAPDGRVSEQPPKPIELPLLPEAWVAGLSEGATDAGPAAAAVELGHALLEQLVTDDRPACAEITSAALIAVDELSTADAGSRHDTAIARTHQLVQLAAAGHPGLAAVLPTLTAKWAELTAGEDREDEWSRMLLTSARKAVTAIGPRQVAADPCLLIGAFSVPAPGPADDRRPEPDAPVEPLPDAVEPPRRLHPIEVIGAHLFDPIADLDQPLAEAVLERTWPAVRHAYDSGAWLLRGPDAWEVRSDLAEWAVSLVANLMPRGNPDAEKGSEARSQAERRRRFMSGGPSGAISKKIRAIVTGGVHPCTLKIADLDQEPWLLWAGGAAWDLRASREAPAPAQVDPATPHLHSAGMRPEPRPTPLWDAFTAAVWPDPELRAWALRVLSIAFTGYADRAMPILIGDQGRGKTQVIALLMSVLGSYAHAADPRLLGGADKAHASIVYALMGRRLSFIDEGPRDSRAGKESLKQLTGGGDLTGNQMNRNPVTFTPTHTLVLTSNDEPHLVDPAVRNRVRLIPCEGDPDDVRRTRAAIGHTSAAAWRLEAPGVLAAMMREAALWVADPDSALTAAAPEAYRYRAEEIAADQDTLSSWLEEAVTPDEVGERATVLYANFQQHCLDRGLDRRTTPTITRWGRELTRLGFPAMHTMQGKRRALRIRPLGGWPTPNPMTGSSSDDGLMTGSQPNPSYQETPVNAGPHAPATAGNDGLTGSETSLTHARAHHAHTNQEFQTGLNPSDPSSPEASPPKPHSAQLADKLLEAKAERERLDAEYGIRSQPPAQASKPKRTKVDAAERAAARGAAKAAAKAAKIADAAGPLVELPALVTRDGSVTAITLGQAEELYRAFAMAAELTVDVETTGYPIGHADYALRTIQLGNEHAAVVLDAADPDHRALAGALLDQAQKLHAHSATADLIPLAEVGALVLEQGWARMHDTVIPAKLADPASTGSDPGLKQLAGAVLGDAAVSPAADAARATLFKAGRWLTDTKATTPVERSGWAQVDPRCTTMIRYAASDVLDDAALARRLPPVEPVLLERERLAQRMTARVAHRGLRLDGEHIEQLLDRERAALADAAARLTGFGVGNPGSDQQVGAVAVQLGARLPTTKTGRVSVAAGVLEPYKGVDGPLGDFVRARLDYQKSETALGLILEPYRQLVDRGDGRARPTVYTLGADTGRMSCLQSDALIEMPRDLAKYPDGVPITEVKPGDWVYAFDHHRELVLRRVKWCAQTGVRQTYTITAENSAGHRLTLRATPEHLIRLRNGDWRATENLMHAAGRPHREDGPRLMTMVRRTVDDGYVKFFPHSIARKSAGTTGGGKNREHRWVLEQITGRKISTKVDVNHIDGNRANNHPSNLQELPMHEHRGNRDLAWGVEQAELQLPTGPNDYRVVSVTAALVEPVWDMEVEEVHNFIANGICVHNCVRPNLQQVPREGGYRACITADPGQLLVSADFAGVELRVAAALSGDANLRRLIAEEDAGQGDGVHWAIARLAFGPGATKADRYAVKRGVFGRIYGGGIPAIARGVGVSETVAAAIIDALDAMLPELSAWSQRVRESVKAGQTQFPTYSGRIVHLPAAFPHKAPNYCIQGTAREALVDTLVKWRETKWGQATLLPVHDELVVAVPEDEAEQATQALVECMTNEINGVRIKAEPSRPAFAWQDAV